MELLLQICQNDQDHDHPNELHNKHTTNPQGAIKQDLCDTSPNKQVNQAIAADDSESIDPEATFYLKKLTEDWANINLVQPKVFRPVRTIIVNKEQNDEIWVQKLATTRKRSTGLQIQDHLAVSSTLQRQTNS